MKCFKWRTAESCSTGHHHLRCSLRNRSSAEEEVTVGPHGHSATLFSPSYDRTKSPFYLNNNFCIYNISLNCPGEIVSLTSKLTDYGLSDADTCQDYLWFSTSSNSHPQKICGDDIIDFRDSYWHSLSSGFSGAIRITVKANLKLRLTTQVIPFHHMNQRNHLVTSNL